jgi:uncharacterized membrane protein YdjX (TVP38/TMEM64 family)
VSDDIREVARKRIKARRDFWYLMVIFAIVIVIVIAVWAITGMGYFWPMWAIFGLLIATVFSALSTFGPMSRPITQDRIDEEVRKMGGGPTA